MAELNRAQLASGMAEKLKQHEERARYVVQPALPSVEKREALWFHVFSVGRYADCSRLANACGRRRD